MKLKQYIWKNGQWNQPLSKEFDSKQTIAFVFFSPEVDTSGVQKEIQAHFPQSVCIGCSGAGEVAGDSVLDQAVILTLCQFETSTVKSFSQRLENMADSYSAGQRLAGLIPTDGLRAVFVLSVGLNVNGSELVRGIRTHLPEGTLISGGLAGDGTRFQTTKVWGSSNDHSSNISAIALYGNDLVIYSEAKAGWLPFGPERLITRSENNILYELDGKPALALYKEFLGKLSKDLPSSGLFFPLFLGAKDNPKSRNTVRTLLSIDEQAQSMTFAGDIPTGETARLMRVNNSSLLEAADLCSKNCLSHLKPNLPALSLIVSCIGRRLVLGSSVDDETLSVFEKLPSGSAQTGFYSYGELAPGEQSYCDLHNQTITLTWIQENIQLK